jgi:hypothetical protein
MTQVVPTLPPAVTYPEIELTPAILGGLAREVAINLRDLPEILSTYKVSRAAYEKIRTTDWFAKAVDMAVIEWNSAANTIVRTQLEVAASYERGFPEAYARALDPKTAFHDTVDFFKHMSDVAGIKKDATQGQAGERFQITINLGADTKLEFEGSRTPLSGDPALPALPGIVLDDAEERV